MQIFVWWLFLKFKKNENAIKYGQMLQYHSVFNNPISTTVFLKIDLEFQYSQQSVVKYNNIPTKTERNIQL